MQDPEDEENLWLLSLNCNGLNSAPLWAGLSQDKETEYTFLKMNSLPNNLDKLEVADNNTKEPHPTNVVDEDKIVTLVDILIRKKASRDNKILRSGIQ